MTSRTPPDYVRHVFINVGTGGNAQEGTGMIQQNVNQIL